MDRSLAADLDLLKSAALDAGEIAMRFFRQRPAAWAKAGGSPVTEADMAVDLFLRETLLAARPEYGWLSEETADDPSRLGCSRVLVVDPIDGTRGFIEGDDRWCVSLAVVEDGRPLVGVLNAAARGELYTAVRGEGAWIAGAALAVTGRAQLAKASIAGPRGWLRTIALQRSAAYFEPHVPSLAYRFACVAAGRFDGAFASPRAHDWDLAACDLLVHEAGGRLTGLDGTVPRYNREDPRHDALAAANPALQPILLASVQDAAREVARGGRR
jgi:myo-inositol-1(or 4)-monophosphatase